MSLGILKIIDLFPQYFLAFVRISSIFIITPVLSSRTVPIRIRVMLSIAITAVILPTLPLTSLPDLVSITGGLLLAKQIFLGFAFGMILLIVFETVAVAGRIISLQMGLGMANQIDPQSNIQVPMLAQFYIIALTLFFLAMNGHLLLIEFIVKSFHVIPLNNADFFPHKLESIVKFAYLIFSGTVSLSLPAIGSLVIVNMIFGVMSRSAPQFHIFTIGFPIILLLGMFIVTLTFPSFTDQGMDLLRGGFNFISNLFFKGA